MSGRSLRVVRIVEGTSVDGPGLRTAIYFAGCDHCCPGCHNPSTWDSAAGESMTVDALVDAVVAADFNVTLTGGDPLQQADLDALAEFVGRVVDAGYTVWCYTGYEYERLVADGRWSRLLGLMDVLVDGPFVQSLRDVSLRFRGSSNQRLVDLKMSGPDAVVLWNG